MSFIDEIRAEFGSAPENPQGGSRMAGQWEIENAFDFCDKVIPKGDAVLDSDKGAVLTAGGIMQLTGMGKIGKSTLLLNICYGLATGRDALSLRINRARRVLYLNGENSPSTMQERLKQFRDYFCIDEEQVNLVRENMLFASVGLQLPKAEAVQEIQRNLKEVRPEVVILDPLKNFFSGEENSADSMRDFMTAIRQLMKEFSFTVIIVHHTGKRQSETDIYSGRGSSVLGDDAEVTASFQKDAADKLRFTLSVTGRNCEEFTLYLTRDFANSYLFTLADKPEFRPDHTLVEIVESLPRQFKTGAFEEAAFKRGIKRSTCFDKLKLLEGEKIIARVARGLYEKVSPEVHHPKELDDWTNGSDAEEQSPEVQNSPDWTTEPEDGHPGF